MNTVMINANMSVFGMEHKNWFENICPRLANLTTRNNVTRKHLVFQVNVESRLRYILHLHVNH